MFLRHMTRLPEGIEAADTFEYVDEETGDVSASAIEYRTDCPTLYPSRPLQISIEFDGDPVPDTLLGATVARARRVVMVSNTAARVYTHCDPRDSAFIDQLAAFGFKDDDGLVRMRRHTSDGKRVTIPSGYTIIRDALMDSMEQKLFLERYNRLYGSAHSPEWLERYIGRDHFLRLMALGRTGIAGEVTVWVEDNIGVIGYVNTMRQYRRHGIASALITLACDWFEQCGVHIAEVNLQEKIPYMADALTKLGFTQTSTLLRYPGIDCDPGSDEEMDFLDMLRPAEDSD